MAENPITVGLWGPPSSGKTMLLASLYLKQELQASDWQVWPTTESEAFIKKMREVTQVNGLFPKATQKGTEEPVFYRFSNKRTGQTASLLIEDRAGVEYVEMEDHRRKALASASALMLLFDPHRRPDLFLADVESTFDAIHIAADRGVGQDPRPVAICLSKADELIRSAEDLAAARSEPDGFARRWLRERGAQAVISRLDQFCARYQIFPVTSVGVRQHWGVVEPVVYYDEDLRPRIGVQNQSLGLLQPFEWLFDKVGTP